MYLLLFKANAWWYRNFIPSWTVHVIYLQKLFTDGTPRLCKASFATPCNKKNKVVDFLREKLVSTTYSPHKSFLAMVLDLTCTSKKVCLQTLCCGYLVMWNKQNFNYRFTWHKNSYELHIRLLNNICINLKYTDYFFSFLFYLGKYSLCLCILPHFLNSCSSNILE